MREFLYTNGFPCPRFLLASSYEEAEIFVKGVRRGIVKPLDSQSSRGIHVVTDDMAFEKEFLDAKSYSICSQKVLVEEFLEGTEFTVDGLKLGEKYEVLAISEKKHYEHNRCVANELFFTNTNTRFDYEKLRQANTALVKAMGLPFGLTHAEYIFCKGEFYLVEIAARGGGTRISSDIVPIMSGVDNYKLLINYLLKENTKLSFHSKNEDNAAVLRFVELPCGKVEEIDDFSDVIEDERIVELRLEFKKGDTLEKPENDRARCGFYIAKANSKEELRRFCTIVDNKLRERIKVVSQ